MPMTSAVPLLDARAQVGLRDASASVKSTATWAAFKPWLRSSVSGTPTAAAPTSSPASRPSRRVARSPSRRRPASGRRLRRCSSARRGPSGPRRRARLPSATGYAPIRSKNSFTPSNHERARGLCRAAFVLNRLRRRRAAFRFCSAVRFTGVSTCTRQNKSPTPLVAHGAYSLAAQAEQACPTGSPPAP